MCNVFVFLCDCDIIKTFLIFTQLDSLYHRGDLNEWFLVE